MLHTLNNVCHSWARVVYGDRLSDVKISDSRHQVVKFASRAVFIEPVELQVFVVIVRTTLESSLRNFNVL